MPVAHVHGLDGGQQLAHGSALGRRILAGRQPLPRQRLQLRLGGQGVVQAGEQVGVLGRVGQCLGGLQGGGFDGSVICAW